MPVEESDDTVKRPAVRPAKRTGRKASDEGRKQTQKREQAGTNSIPETEREPDLAIPATTALTDSIAASDSTTDAPAADTPVEQIDVSTTADREPAAIDTPTADDTEAAISEGEQAVPALREALPDTQGTPAADIAEPAGPVEQELDGIAVDTTTLPPPDTPRPEFDASSTEDEEDSIPVGEVPPDTPFDAQPDTPRPDDGDELEPAASPVDTPFPVENESTADVEAPADITDPIDSEAADPVEVESPDSIIDQTEAPVEADNKPLADGEAARITAAPVSDLPLSWPEMDVTEAQSTQTPAIIPAEQPIPAPPEQRPVRKRETGRLRVAATIALMVVLLISSLLFWQDVNAPHLYISTLNPASGAIATRTDHGSGYNGEAVIAPAEGQSSVFFGVAGNQPSAQQVVELEQNSWQQTGQFSAPLAHGSLSVTEQGNLVIESEHGLEVTTSGGQLLWRMTGDLPARGAHAFRPAYDSTTLYTVKSAAAGQIAAYDLQHGTPRWTTNLNDTLNYAPPLLLDGTTLYVAGDHAIFALNSSTGSLLWTAPHAARTLLLSGARSLLIAACADGLLALNPGDGSPLWTFYGQAGKMTASGVPPLTPTQFYQASATATTIYATGIAWKAPEIQPELWLYALDAATGRLHWSRQLAANLLSADAGRVFTPLAYSAQHLVILEQQQESGALLLAAYDADNGQMRWQTPFPHTGAASPLALSNNTLLFISIQTDSGSALAAMTPLRLLWLATALVSLFGLLVLAFLTLRARPYRPQTARKQLLHVWKAARGKRPSWKLAVMVLLAVALVGVTSYTQLNQTRGSVLLVDVQTGATRWQQAASTSTQALATGGQLSFLSVAGTANMRRVQAIDTSGATRWQTFASAGVFSIPAVPTQPGTLLLALSGYIPLPTAFAPADPAYPAPLDSLYILSLLNRNTGQPLWQNAIITPGDQQSAAVLGADRHFIYIASLQTNGAAIQLLAVDQTSGQISWRISGPPEPASTPLDNGTLLLQGRQIIWQVEGAVYAIDSQMGQIAWRRAFGSDNTSTLLQEETQMGVTNSLLLVARSQSVYAIDPASGNVLWTAQIPGSNGPQEAGGLSIDGNTLLLYGNTQVQAINLASRNPIWTKTLPAPVHALKVAASGRQIYAATGSSGAGEMLMALDSKTGVALWRFQPAGQAIFTGNIIEEQNILLATACTSETAAQICTQEDLYALNATTGAVNWQVASISTISISPDGSLLLLQKAGRAGS